MAEKCDHHCAMYTCMDENPDYTRGTYANLNGALFYFVEGVCGSLPCKPYIAGHELTCEVFLFYFILQNSPYIRITITQVCTR